MKIGLLPYFSLLPIPSALVDQAQCLTICFSSPPVLLDPGRSSNPVFPVQAVKSGAEVARKLDTCGFDYTNNFWEAVDQAWRRI